MKRWPLYAAIVYVLLLVAGLSVVPAAPSATDSAATVARYYVDHASGVRLATWLATWSMVPLVLLAVSLRTRLVGLGRDVLLVGAIGVAFSTMVWSWFAVGLALHPHSLDPSVARTVADVSGYFGPTLTVVILLFVVPVAWAAWRGEGGLPRWLAWVTIVFAIEQAIETVTIFGTRGFIEPGGAMNGLLGTGLYFVWIIAAGAAVSRVLASPPMVAA